LKVYWFVIRIFGSVINLEIEMGYIDIDTIMWFGYVYAFIGWSEHFVSKRRYHFIISMDNEWHKPLNEEALDTQSHMLHGMS
jgi:hypothetical protein